MNFWDDYDWYILPLSLGVPRLVLCFYLLKSYSEENTLLVFVCLAFALLMDGTSFISAVINTIKGWRGVKK